jgi:hypothetical protein
MRPRPAGRQQAQLKDMVSSDVNEMKDMNQTKLSKRHPFQAYGRPKEAASPPST